MMTTLFGNGNEAGKGRGPAYFSNTAPLRLNTSLVTLRYNITL